MTANTKTPLQTVVSVICGCLCELPSDYELPRPRRITTP